MTPMVVSFLLHITQLKLKTVCILLFLLLENELLLQIVMFLIQSYLIVKVNIGLCLQKCTCGKHKDGYYCI